MVTLRKYSLHTSITLDEVLTSLFLTQEQLTPANGCNKQLGVTSQTATAELIH